MNKIVEATDAEETIPYNKIGLLDVIQFVWVVLMAVFLGKLIVLTSMYFETLS